MGQLIDFLGEFYQFPVSLLNWANLLIFWAKLLIFWASFISNIPYMLHPIGPIKHRYRRIHQTDSLALRQFLMDLKFHSVFLLTEKYGNRYIAKPSFINNHRLGKIFRCASSTNLHRKMSNECLSRMKSTIQQHISWSCR